MSAIASPAPLDRDVLKRAAAEAAVKLVENDMVVGLGSGSTAAFAVEALGRLRREGLRFIGIPTSQRTADLARAAGIPLTSFGEHRQIDLTIDGADEVERGTLNLIKGGGGALLHEKIVAAATRQLAIIVDSTKLVDRLGTNVPVPVEVIAFGLEATQAALEVLGASVRLRLATPGQPFVTDSGNHILDCKFDRITDPARLEERIRRIVGVVDSGLFIGRADPVFVADPSGVRRLSSARSHRGTPPILVMMGVSGSGKTTVAKELAARLGWAFEEGDALHPALNIAKMHAGIPLTDKDRLPWLERVAAWIDAQRAKKQPGIITCSALKRSYRRIIIGDRPEVRLVYLRGGRDLIAEHLAGRQGHFMPSSLLWSQIDTLEEPDPSEDPIIVDEGAPPGRSSAELAEEIIHLLGASATVTPKVALTQIARPDAH
jgi:ribose 5-phosphate isomerase A